VPCIITERTLQLLIRFFLTLPKFHKRDLPNTPLFEILAFVGKAILTIQMAKRR
jgi:hypothetical protein